MPDVEPPFSVCVDSPSPSELFKIYFDHAAIKTLCANTNKNAAKNIAAGKNFKWTELTEAEMYHYFGLTLYMGVLKLPTMRDFWHVNSIFHVEYLSEVMSRHRFLTITWNVHMSDPAEDALNDRKTGTGDYDCLHRVRSLYDVSVSPAKLYTTHSKTSLWMSSWSLQSQSFPEAIHKNQANKAGDNTFCAV